MPETSRASIGSLLFFFFNDTATTEIYTLSLHDALPIRFVYFLVDCVVSLLTRTEGQRTTATGIVGHEGMVGMSLVYGVDASSVRAQVLAAGTAMRMSAERFRDEFRR